MKIITVSVSYSYTFNLGNYTSIRPEVSLTVELGEGDDPQEVEGLLLSEARQSVEEAIDDELIRLNRIPHFDRARGDAIKRQRAEDLGGEVAF